jgi:hypothetical protein
METIELNPISLGDIGTSSMKLNTNENTSKKSTNFGPGIELLMNDKKKNIDKNDTTINLDDLDTLESSLNNLSSPDGENKKSLREARSDLFTNPDILKEKKDISFNIGNSNNDNISTEPIKLNIEPEKTWDGYQQFNNIPLDPDKEVNNKPNISREEELREKFKYLRKLEMLERKGIELSKKYTMESSLLEMQGEYETIKNEKEKQNSMKFQGRMLMAAITGLEFLNNRFDPFDLKLDGWSEQVNESLDDYDDIFGELHEKYQSKAKIAPELKLLFQLTGSAVMLHMTNTMFKSSMPGMDDIMRQNPELMEQFTKAAVNQMGQENPGFGNFMGGVMNQSQGNMHTNGPTNSPPQQQYGPPPSPIRTKNPSRQDNYPRPDIGFGRGGPEVGVSLNEQFDNPSAPERSRRGGQRPEMKGPSDVSDLLSGLKEKNIVLDNSEPAKRSKRKPVSEKNTISLNI